MTTPKKRTASRPAYWREFESPAAYWRQFHSDLAMWTRSRPTKGLGASAVVEILNRIRDRDGRGDRDREEVGREAALKMLSAAIDRLGPRAKFDTLLLAVCIMEAAD